MDVIGLLVIGLLIPLAVMAARGLNNRQWRSSLVALRLRFPSDISVGDIEQWLGRIQVLTEAPDWSLLLKGPVVLEVIADYHEIQHVLLMPRRAQSSVLASLAAALPRVQVSDASNYLDQRPVFAIGVEATQTQHGGWPLSVDAAATTSQHILASMTPANPDERICVQYVLSGARRPKPRSATSGPPQTNGPWWPSDEVLKDYDRLRLERIKYKYPLLLTSVRVGIVARSRPRALQLLAQVWPAFSGMDGPGVRIVRRLLPSWWVAKQLSGLQLPVTRFGLTLNTAEASGLVACAAGGLRLPSLPGIATRALPAPHTLARRGLVIAESDYLRELKVS